MKCLKCERVSRRRDEGGADGTRERGPPFLLLQGEGGRGICPVRGGNTIQVGRKTDPFGTRLT